MMLKSCKVFLSSGYLRGLMMLKSCKVFLSSGYLRGRLIQPYTLAAQRDYSMVVSHPNDDSVTRVLRGNNWDPDLLKSAFSQFKTLSHGKKHLWLAAHFILRKRRTVTEIWSSNSDSETEAEDENKCEIMNIVCSDKICIDAKPFMRESLAVQGSYEWDSDVIKVKINSEIIKKVQLLCAERALIQDDHANNDDLQHKKLNDLNSKFRQENRIYALDLMIAALELEIKFLLDLMIEDIDDMFTKMTSDDEAYKILSVNLRGEYPRGKFELMKHKLQSYSWAFDADSHKPGLRAKENMNWDPELLKVSFYQYKTLPHEQRRQWLIAHFLLRQPSDAFIIQNYRILTEEEKRKLRLEFPNTRFFEEECKEEEVKLESDRELAAARQNIEELEALAANRQKESLVDGHQIEEITEEDRAWNAGLQFKKAQVTKFKKQLKELVME